MKCSVVLWNSIVNVVFLYIDTAAYFWNVTCVILVLNNSELKGIYNRTFAPPAYFFHRVEWTLYIIVCEKQNQISVRLGETWIITAGNTIHSDKGPSKTSAGGAAGHSQVSLPKVRS